MNGYFENFYPAYGDGPIQQDIEDVGVFRPSYVRGGLGADYLLGGAARANVRVVDLSELAVPVALEFAGVGAGSISDGIDTIVFQGIEEIILPGWIFAAMPPSPRACSDHGVRLSVAEHIAAPVKHIAAE